jgi:hypothetical protein
MTCDARGKALRTSQLLAGTGRLGEEAKRCDIARATRDGVAQSAGQGIEVRPVTKLSLDEYPLGKRAVELGIELHRACISLGSLFDSFLLVGDLAELVGETSIVGSETFGFAAGVRCLFELALSGQALR